MALKIVATLSLAALAGCAAVTDRQSTVRSVQAERDFPPEGQMIDVNGRQVHAVVAGSGPDVIMIHGAGGNSREFTFDFMDRLKDRYRVIIFDRPGLGYTDRTSERHESVFTTQAESPAEQAAMLLAAAQNLGVTNPILVGHSYGATVAMAWALDHPDTTAGVVNLAGPSHPWPGGLSPFYTLPGSAVGGVVIPPLVGALTSERRIDRAIGPIFAPQPVPDGYLKHIGGPLTVRPDSFRANARQVNTLRPHVVEMSARFATEFTVPLEIIHGDADQTVPVQIHSIPLSHAIPHANLVVLEGVGHMPHHARPDLVEDAIARIAQQAGLH